MKTSLLLLISFVIFGFFPLGGESAQYRLIVFEGSDWCANCIRLEKNILADTAFINYLLKEKIELVKVDFPQRKKLSKEQLKANEALAEKYNFTGTYPTVLLVHPEINSSTRIDYRNQSRQEFTAEIQKKLQLLK